MHRLDSPVATNTARMKIENGPLRETAYMLPLLRYAAGTYFLRRTRQWPFSSRFTRPLLYNRNVFSSYKRGEKGVIKNSCHKGNWYEQGPQPLAATNHPFHQFSPAFCSNERVSATAVSTEQVEVCTCFTWS